MRAPQHRRRCRWSTVVLVMLLGAVIAAWGSTWSHHVWWFQTFTGNQRMLAVQSGRGRLWFAYHRMDHPRDHFLPEQFQEIDEADAVGFRPVFSAGENGRGSFGELIWAADEPPLPSVGSYKYAVRVQGAGFKLQRRARPFQAKLPDDQGEYSLTLQLPYWALGLAAGIPLALRGRREQRRRRLAKEGTQPCAKCGYDLRAHAPGSKCPECGEVVGGEGKIRESASAEAATRL